MALGIHSLFSVCGSRCFPHPSTLVLLLAIVLLLSLLRVVSFSPLEFIGVTGLYTVGAVFFVQRIDWLGIFTSTIGWCTS